MSYDLTVYLRRPVPAPDDIQGDSWQIVCHGPLRIEDEDIPPEQSDAVGAARHIWQLHLEGERTGAALDALNALLAQAMSDQRAVVIDEQAGTWQSATKTGSLAIDEGRPDKPPSGAISFFFEDADAFHPARLPDFLVCMARHLPGAVPGRYGPYEPLQHKVEDGDTAPLVRAWADDTMLCMRASAPFGWLLHSLPCAKAREGWHPDHWFRAAGLVGRIELELKPRFFADPRLVEAGLSFLAEAAAITGSFYAEMRRDPCPVRSWFWRGLPPGTVEALVLGSPYVALWPEAGEMGASLPDGRVLLRRRAGQPAVPNPPRRLLMPDPPGDPRSVAPSAFAREFPFKRPPSAISHPGH